MKPHLGYDKGVCLLLFIIAVVVRFTYLFESADSPAFQVPVVDALVYHKAASSLAQGGGFSRVFFFQPFLYPFFLSGIYELFGASILAARMAGAMLGGVTCVLVFLLGRKVFGKGAGIGEKGRHVFQAANVGVAQQGVAVVVVETIVQAVGVDEEDDEGDDQKRQD